MSNIADMAHDRGDFVRDVDGFWYYWPTHNTGHYSAHILREIADELDRINKPWDEEITAFFEEEERQERNNAE